MRSLLSETSTTLMSQAKPAGSVASDRKKTSMMRMTQLRSGALAIPDRTLGRPGKTRLRARDKTLACPLRTGPSWRTVMKMTMEACLRGSQPPRKTPTSNLSVEVLPVTERAQMNRTITSSRTSRARARSKRILEGSVESAISVLSTTSHPRMRLNPEGRKDEMMRRKSPIRLSREERTRKPRRRKRRGARMRERMTRKKKRVNTLRVVKTKSQRKRRRSELHR